MSAESVAVNRVLNALFTADAALTALVGDRFFDNLAPALVNCPAVVIKMQAGTDQSALDGKLAMSRNNYEIKAVGRGEDMTAVEPIAKRIYELLAGYSVVTDEGRFRFTRVQEINQADAAFATSRFNFLGGVYRVDFSPTI